MVPTIENAFVNNTENMLLQVEPIICVSLFDKIANEYIMVVIKPTLIITNKADLTIVLINSF
jgi:hypothetical protein